MKALVIGGDGFVGLNLVAALQSAGADVIRSSRRGIAGAGVIYLDLEKQLPTLPQTEVVYLVAAMTTFRECEGNAGSWIVNVDSQIALAKQAVAMGAFPVFISSDSVEWSGTQYAREKAQAELGVLMLNGAVVRPTRIRPPRIGEFCQLLVRVGKQRLGGVHRWQ